MRYVRVFSLAAVLVAVLVAPVGAAPPSSFDFLEGPGSGQRTAWIEQQDDWPKPADFIRNSSGCPWSVNDHLNWGPIQGYLDPGAVSGSYCIVSDFNPVYATRNGTTAWWSMAAYGYFGLSLRTSLATHSVEVCYSPQGRCFPLSPTWDAAFKAWRWEFCGRASYAPDDPALVDIEGSHGGRGVVTTVTARITNTGTKRDRTVWGVTGFSSDVYFPAGCEGPTHDEVEP